MIRMPLVKLKTQNSKTAVGGISIDKWNLLGCRKTVANRSDATKNIFEIVDNLAPPSMNPFKKFVT